MTARPRRLERVAESLVQLGDAIVLGLRAVSSLSRRPYETRSLMRELDTQGSRAFGLLLIMSAFTGLVLAFQFGQNLERFGARQYIGQVTTVALLRELMPVLTALVIGGRIVAGIAAELGAMVVTEQVDAIRALGADPAKKLVLPRVLATSIVLPLFTVIGDVVGTLAAMLVAWMEFGVPARYFLEALHAFVTITDFGSGIVKAAVFGAVGGVIACHTGLRTIGGTEGVGRSTTRAVVASSLAVIVLDYWVTRIFFPDVTT